MFANSIQMLTVKRREATKMIVGYSYAYDYDDDDDGRRDGEGRSKW